MAKEKSKFTAHDVRQLCECAKCGQMGMEREMVVVRLHLHCAYAFLGTAVLTLPDAERQKLRLCDVPDEVMMELIRKVRRRK